MFQQNHRTARGKTLLIAQMEDEHLLNMIGAVVTWAERANSEMQDIMLRTQSAALMAAHGGDVFAEVQRKVYGLPKPPKLEEASEQYAGVINQLAARLEPYLLEAWTREFSVEGEETLAELRERWTATVGRNSALPSMHHHALAAPAALDEEDDLPF